MNIIKKIILISILVLILGFVWYGSRKQQEDRMGSIEGSLNYPSESIPENLIICARDISTEKEFCVSDHIKNNKYKNGLGYRIDVPIGMYYVFAKNPSSATNVRNYEAYYSEFVVCGMDVRNCFSHNPIKVIVNEKETTENILPWDWYNNIY